MANSNNGGERSFREEDYHAELMNFLRECGDMRSSSTGKSSLKQGLYAGGGAIAGGILLGPVGSLVGGVTGSIVGYMRSDPYEGYVQKLVRLSPTNQDKLVRAVGKVLSENAPTTTSADVLESPQSFRRTLWEFATKKHVRDEIWRLCREALEDGSGSSAHETVLTS